MKCVGNLTEEQACDIGYLDSTDIVLDLTDNLEAKSVVVSDGSIGFRARGGTSIQTKRMDVSRLKSDALTFWNGGSSIEHLEVNHCLPVLYSDANHADILQAYARSTASGMKYLKVFDGLYIGSANVVIECEDERDKKNGFIFSEYCSYRNISLFSKGLKFKSDSSAPYFLDMTNACDAVIGSQEHPIDPQKVSGKGIRIGGSKSGVPKCKNITIHAYEGLNIVLGEDAKANTDVIYHEREVLKVNDYTMSAKGIKQLAESEGAINHIYSDQAGLATIGVGHLLNQSEISSGKIQLNDGEIIYLDAPITDEQVEAILKDDLARFNSCVAEKVTTELTQGQFDALVHFAFNIGEGAFANSTLLRKLNDGDYDAVTSELKRWNIITLNGKKLISEGLVNRREVECKMWQEGCIVDYDLGAIINPDDEVIEEPKVYKYPIATKKQMRGIDKPDVPLIKTRTIWGVILTFLGFGGTTSIGTVVQDKISKVVVSGIEDPVDSLIRADEVISKLSDVTNWLMYGMSALIIVLVGTVIVLYARVDDRNNGVN